MIYAKDTGPLVMTAKIYVGSVKNGHFTIDKKQISFRTRYSYVCRHLCI